MTARPAATARPRSLQPGPRPAVPDPADLPDPAADWLAAVACQLAGRIRDEDPADVARWLAAKLPDPADVFRLVFVLAAAVPVDRPWSELVAWIAPPRPGETLADRRRRTCRDAARRSRIRRALATPARPTPVAVARERQAAVARLTEQGLGPRQIADLLGVSRTTVYRHRSSSDRQAAA